MATLRTEWSLVSPEGLGQFKFQVFRPLRADAMVWGVVFGDPGICRALGADADIVVERADVMDRLVAAGAEDVLIMQLANCRV